MTTWITDAIHFIDVFGKPISQSMPHIYLSALAFAPWMSMIRQHYASLYPSIGILKANRPSGWLDIQPVLAAHTSWVTSVAFSPDGARIASGSGDNTIRLWDAKTGAAIGEPLRGHTDWVRSVAFSPDGAQIASGSKDGTVRLWDAKTSAAIGEPFHDHTRSVQHVVFSPDGTSSSYSYDGNLLLQRTYINHGGTASNVDRGPTSLPTTDVVSGMKHFPLLFVSHPRC